MTEKGRREQAKACRLLSEGYGAGGGAGKWQVSHRGRASLLKQEASGRMSGHDEVSKCSRVEAGQWGDREAAAI